MTLKSAGALTFITGIILMITGFVRSWGSEADFAFYIGGLLFIVVGVLSEIINDRLKELEEKIYHNS
ncbi:hypothetical protein JMA_03060 [Jeotgalibacillus malaysiensis]|uniref:Uncharacterized protein n=1 Tax=Jeotgalibacillus malaysiensis TaxID=1508404 RepID=A0A0B5AM36_9BACL|nr:hypothetical protein [Jeotgalibacillus malaysiensis]AJD89623.1 hypothetical protein JMA_03060 [Jeotgalibacillus malaysiensis]